MGKFINPFTDIGFKRIFGQEFSKPLLIDFLNNLLIGERHITDVTFHDKELPAPFEEGRTIIYDINCETDTGEKIVVEMQNRLQPNFKARTLYYAAEAIARQGEKGKDWNYDVKAVYLVAFINDHDRTFSRQFRTDVILMDKELKEPFTDLVKLIYLQLPLFTKDADKCKNDFERWIYVLKHMETLNRLPWAAQSAVFQRLAEISDLSSLTREEREYYDSAIRIYRDNIYTLEGERQKGRAEGRAEGRADVARQLKAMGMALSDISKATGLQEADIEQL
ncbi:MAG: PD-(D/E)XK nuclease family transposase [Bacteroidaceae bacterium]|nr:PD-(D/E)XK nuclease family transposase [Bacteroidaceae bacterium]